MDTTGITATGYTAHPERVCDLLEHLDTQYRVEGLNDAGEIEPDWAKIVHFADLMRTGRFNFDDEDILMVGTPDGDRMIFDGNHRVLAADMADVDTLDVIYTLRPFR